MALVSIPFFALLGAIMEGALIFWSGEVLETAVHEASRQIYTGQFQGAQPQNTPNDQQAAKFKELVCNEVKVLLPCQNLHVDVRTFTTFPRRFQSPIVDGDLDPAFGAFQPPQPNQIVVVRAAVKVKVIFSLLHANRSNFGEGSPERLVMASAAFRAEPFNNAREFAACSRFPPPDCPGSSPASRAAVSARRRTEWRPSSSP
jgi:Flp pilus assembly protein TadG